MPDEETLPVFRGEITLQVDYRRELNEQQYAAVTALPRTALVIAGAGSGKTRTLIYRVGFLLEQGIPPDRILLLTFTNKAAAEMMRRVRDLLGFDLAALWGGTFHSIGNRVLRRYADRLGYQNDFTILDREDSDALIKVCLQEQGIDPKAAGFPKPAVLSEIFSLAANTQQPIARLIEQRYQDFEELTDKIVDVHTRFAARKKESNVTDFDDLLVLWFQLMSQDPEVCSQLQRRFQFILVDEYQDTNALQSQIIDMLAARHRNVMVVGDDAQSIYSWRGANFRNIFEFSTRYPDAQVFKIEINYRSTPEILALANAAIAANKNQFEKNLTACRRSGMKPTLVACGSGNEQAEIVAQRILQLHDSGTRLSDIAVLYRSHFHALELQLKLTEMRIPYDIVSGSRFYEQAHIKDVAAYLRFIVNPNDEISFRRLVRMLPGIGNRAADKLWAKFKEQLSQIHGAPGSDPKLAVSLQGCAKLVPQKAALAWADFSTTISQLEGAEERDSPADLIGMILDSSYTEFVHENYTNAEFRLEDIAQLRSYALQFDRTENFLTQLALLSNLEADLDRPIDRDRDQVRLSTVHQAKGLEFSVVFIIMLAEGLFPTFRATKDPQLMEEERRLFYVAVTRAKDELYLLYPIFRAVGGSSGPLFESQFVQSLPRDLMEERDLTGRYRPWLEDS